MDDPSTSANHAIDVPPTFRSTSLRSTEATRTVMSQSNVVFSSYLDPVPTIRSAALGTTVERRTGTTSNHYSKTELPPVHTRLRAPDKRGNSTAKTESLIDELDEARKRLKMAAIDSQDECKREVQFQLPHHTDKVFKGREPQDMTSTTSKRSRTRRRKQTGRPGRRVRNTSPIRDLVSSFHNTTPAVSSRPDNDLDSFNVRYRSCLRRRSCRLSIIHRLLAMLVTRQLRKISDD